MCGHCWVQMGQPVMWVEEIAAAAELIKALYVLEETGGPLHVELDDWNLHGKIEPTYAIPGNQYRPEGYPDRYSPEVHALCDLIAALLNTMTEGQRGSALAHAEGMAVQGAVAEPWRQWGQGDLPDRHPAVEPAAAEPDPNLWYVEHGHAGQPHRHSHPVGDQHPEGTPGRRHGGVRTEAR